MQVRFGYQLGPHDQADPLGAARRAEAAGFDVVLVSDHVGPGLAPMVALAAMAGATERIRLGTMVLNHDMRNPVQLAWEAATLDRLSHGRFELGLGAGHSPQEYAATGIEMQPAAWRKQRLMESVEVIRSLLDGDVVTRHSELVHIDSARVDPPCQDHLPILVGGNGAALLAHAGAHADIVGLQGLARTLPDGHSHTVKWSAAWLDQQLEQIRSGAGQRFEQVELSALVQVTDITDDRDAVLADLCAQVEGLTFDDALTTPYLLVGTVDQIVQKIVDCRERWGIRYFVTRALDAFGPVISALR